MSATSTQLNNKKAISHLVWLFTLVYMVSYMTRINYGAIISEMESATNFSRSSLSMALTGSFITYGVGQIISGVLGDKFSPKKLVLCGLMTTVLMNFLIPICNSPYIMTAVWCINGFAQSFIWPPLVRLMTSLLSSDDYKRVATKVVCGSSVGTILIYLISPLIISLFNWKAVFLFSALCGVVMLVLWACSPYDEQPQIIEKSKDEYKDADVKLKKNFSMFSPVMICIMLAIVFQGMLRDGVTTWMPTYVSDVYKLSNIISILSGVILPIITIVCMETTTAIYSKLIKNPVICATLIFGLGMISAIVIYILSGQNFPLSVSFMALLTGCMNSVNVLLITMLPAHFKKFGKTSTVTGALNSCTYIGSALSTYGIALLSEKLGWNFTLFTWILICAIGTFFCVVSIKGWNKKYQSE